MFQRGGVPYDTLAAMDYTFKIAESMVDFTDGYLKITAEEDALWLTKTTTV